MPQIVKTIHNTLEQTGDCGTIPTVKVGLFFSEVVSKTPPIQLSTSLAPVDIELKRDVC